MGRKERKPRESAPYVPDFGTQGTGAAHGGQRSRRGRGPRMAWPPSAVLEGGAHKRSAVGRIAPKGRTSRGPLPAGPRPTCENAPFRPLPGAAQSTARRRQPSARYDLRKNEKGQKRSSAGLFVLAVIRFLDSLRSLEMTAARHNSLRSLEMTAARHNALRSLEMTAARHNALRSPETTAARPRNRHQYKKKPPRSPERSVESSAEGRGGEASGDPQRGRTPAGGSHDA